MKEVGLKVKKKVKEFLGHQLGTNMKVPGVMI